MMFFYFLAAIVIVVGGISLFFVLIGAALTVYDWFFDGESAKRREAMRNHPANGVFDWEHEFKDLAQ